MHKLRNFFRLVILSAALTAVFAASAETGDIFVKLTASRTGAVLEVTEPTGEKCTVWNPETSIGGELTAGGREYRLYNAMDGYYYIEIRATEGFVSDREAWAQVSILLFEGTPDEIFHTLGGQFRITEEVTRVAALRMPQGTLEDWGLESVSETDCFIAAAAYGTPAQSSIMTLTRFRDGSLVKSSIGSKMTEAYYALSPPMANIISGSDFLRAAARIHLAPAVRLAEIFTRE